MVCRMNEDNLGDQKEGEAYLCFSPCKTGPFVTEDHEKDICPSPDHTSEKQTASPHYLCHPTLL